MRDEFGWLVDKLATTEKVIPAVSGQLFKHGARVALSTFGAELLLADEEVLKCLWEDDGAGRPRANELLNKNLEAFKKYYGDSRENREDLITSIINVHSDVVGGVPMSKVRYMFKEGKYVEPRFTVSVNIPDNFDVRHTVEGYEAKMPTEIIKKVSAFVKTAFGDAPKAVKKLPSDLCDLIECLWVTPIGSEREVLLARDCPEELRYIFTGNAKVNGFLTQDLTDIESFTDEALSDVFLRMKIMFMCMTDEYLQATLTRHKEYVTTLATAHDTEPRVISPIVREFLLHTLDAVRNHDDIDVSDTLGWCVAMERHLSGTETITELARKEFRTFKTVYEVTVDA